MIGSIIFEIATPSEASAFGVLGVLILAAAFRLLTWGAKGTTLFQVAGAAFPFLICDAILRVLPMLVPAIALYLPNLMR